MRYCADVHEGWCCHQCHDAWENWHEFIILHDKNRHPFAQVCCGRLIPAHALMLDLEGRR